MVSHLSTFSSKVAHNAAFWTVLLIVGIEFFGGRKLADTVDVHQVDRLCERIERDRFDAPVVVLGDSVAEGAFREREADTTRFAILASNQAIEATGQLFLFRRYLQHNRAPERLLLMALDPTRGKLEQRYTENYVQRVFTRWDEIAYMARWTCDPAFVLKCVSYKLVPSFRYRLHLQESLVGFRHTDIYSGFAKREAALLAGESKPMTAVLTDWVAQKRGNHIAPHSLGHLLTAARDVGTEVVFASPPMLERRLSFHSNVIERLEHAMNTAGHGSIWREYTRAYPEALFYDGAHLSKAGLRIDKPTGDEILGRLWEEAWRTRAERNQTALHGIEEIVNRARLGLPQRYRLHHFCGLEGAGAEAYCWSRPGSAVDLLTSASGGRHHLTLTVSDGSPVAGRQMSVTIGDLKHVVDLTPEPRAHTFSVEISEDSSRERWVRARLDTEAWSPHDVLGSSDTRALGLRLHAVAWECDGEEPGCISR